MGGYIRGKTKLETYKRFRAKVNQRKIEEATDLILDAGAGPKMEVYRQMRKDLATGEWVLRYHFGK